jgi:hypothetical protein
VQVNIQIMRTFIRTREMQENQKLIFTQVNKHAVKFLQHDRKFEEVFQALDDMRQAPKELKKRKSASLRRNELVL